MACAVPEGDPDSPAGLRSHGRSLIDSIADRRSGGFPRARGVVANDGGDAVCVEQR